MLAKRSWLSLLIAGLVLGGLLGLPGSSAATAAQQIEIAVVWSGAELDAFNAVIAKFEEKNPDVDVVVNSVGRDLPTVLITRFEAGNPPDLAAMPNPGQMAEFAREGGLVALDPAIVADHPKAFVDLATVEGKLYGVFLSADLKSLVWYNKKEFAKRGYKIPTTWDELLDLSDQIVADGFAPWCIGLESGAASGWPGTDWIEDLMLRISGPELYDQWVAHDISWRNPVVRAAWEAFGQIARNEQYVFGGTTGVLTTNFGDAPAPLFTDPPGCFLHRQATFIQSFIKNINPDLVAGEDYDIFVLPAMGPGLSPPLLGAGDLISVFRDSDAARRLIAYLASAEAQALWVGRLGKLAVNKKVDPAVYPDPVTAKAAEILGQAEVFRFDGSDLMPAAIGSGAFWTGVMDYVSGQDLDTVLAEIEKAADEAYTSGAATNK